MQEMVKYLKLAGRMRSYFRFIPNNFYPIHDAMVETVIFWAPSFFRLSVEDDGVGFDAAAAGESFTASGGFGLFSIGQQLAHIAGRLEVTSSPGEGTRVVVTAPLGAREAAGT